MKSLVLAICASGLALSTIQAQLSDGLVSYYDFEADFTNHASASGPDGVGTNGAAAAVAGGVSGNAMQLADPTVNQHMRVPVDFGDGATLGQNFTISTLYNLNPIPTDNGTSRYFVFESQIDFDVSYGTRDLGLGEPGINDGQVFTTGASTNVPDAAIAGWHHVLQVYSLAEGSVNIVTYVDGELVSSIATATASFGDTGINFGAARDSQTNRGFDGLIDEVALWSRGLSTEEIATVYALGLNGEPVVDTVPPDPDPVIVSFAATPASVEEGADSTLSWEVTGSTSVTLSNGFGNVAAAGSQVVTPTGPSTYTLVAINGNAVVTAQATVDIVLPPADLSRSLVGYYPLDADFANHPSLSADEDGTALNGATAGVTGGTAGNAMQLNTAPNQHMNAPISFGGAGSDLGDAFSISAWYNLNEPPAANGSSRYFVFESETAFDVSYGIRDSGVGEAGINDGQAFTQGANLVIGDAATGGWRHVLQTYRPSDGTTQITTYIDGVASGVISVATANASDTGINFGAPRSSTTNRGFDGMIDEVALWSRELTGEEIALVFELGSNGSGVLGTLEDFVVTGISYDETSGNASIEFVSVAGGSYAIDSSLDFLSWDEETDNFKATGERSTFIHNTNELRSFYRVRRIE